MKSKGKTLERLETHHDDAVDMVGGQNFRSHLKSIVVSNDGESAADLEDPYAVL